MFPSDKILKEASWQLYNKRERWDFDTDTSLCENLRSMVDLGSFSLEKNPSESRSQLTEIIKDYIEQENKVIVTCGDDSVSIPPICALEPLKDVYVLQIDAHLEWRNELNNERYGGSSVMRRISEFDWVKGITQIGLRGLGTSTKMELIDAQKWGVNIITALDLLELKVSEIVSKIPDGIPLYISLDLDGINFSELPSVDTPTPGGPYLTYVIALLKALGLQRKLVGINIVEFSPRNYMNNLGLNASLRLLTVAANALSQN